MIMSTHHTLMCLSCAAPITNRNFTVCDDCNECTCSNCCAIVEEYNKTLHICPTCYASDYDESSSDDESTNESSEYDVKTDYPVGHKDHGIITQCEYCDKLISKYMIDNEDALAISFEVAFCGLNCLNKHNREDSDNKMFEIENIH